MGWTHLKCERTTALCVKLNTWACRRIPQANIWSECPMYGKRKSDVFFAVRVGFQVSFWKFYSAGTYVTSSQRSNVQVTITVTSLNFAVTGSRILLHPLSSSRRGKPSRKIALNSNGEVNCRELARRPWTWIHTGGPTFCETPRKRVQPSCDTLTKLKYWFG